MRLILFGYFYVYVSGYYWDHYLILFALVLLIQTNEWLVGRLLEGSASLFQKLPHTGPYRNHYPKLLWLKLENLSLTLKIDLQTN